MAFEMISEFDLDQFGDMNPAEGEVSLSKNDLSMGLFPELSVTGMSDVSLSLPFEDDKILNVTDDDEDLMSYLGNGRDKTSSIGSMSPRDTSDAFEDGEPVSPPVVEHKKLQNLKVVRIVKLPNTGVVRLVDNVETKRIEDCNNEKQSMSKNAVAARENRQKKKAYVQGLEHSVEKLRVENRSLKNENDKMNRSIESLSAEVRYLKSVLANQSTLSGLLRNIGATPGVQFRSSIGREADDEGDVEVSDKKPSRRFCRKRKFVNEDREQARKENVAHNRRLVESMSQPKKPKTDHCYVPEVHSSSESEVDGEVGGVCLHVNKNSVSLEFCASCSTQASKQVKKQVR